MKQSDYKDARTLLDTFFHSTNETNSERALEELLLSHAAPVIEKVLAGKLPGARFFWQREDLISFVYSAILLRLRTMKENTDHSLTIQNFSDYVAVIALNAWNQHLRGANPVFARVRNSIRYVVTHHPELALWKYPSGLVCGYKKWKDVALPVRSDIPRTVELSPQKDLLSRIKQYFDHVQAPVPFLQIVNYFCSLENPSRIENSADDLEKVASVDEPIDLRLERIEDLEWIYREIQNLPVNQRRALLLSLRDENGGGILSVFTIARIASIREFAELLEIPIETFVNLWNQLPLEDRAIGEMIGIARQQVINLRKSARERLSRRMKKEERNIAANSPSSIKGTTSQ